MPDQAGTTELLTGVTGAYQTWEARTPATAPSVPSEQLPGIQPPMVLTTGVGEWAWTAGELTNIWGSTVIAPGLIPANSWLLGVTIEVLQDVAGVTGFDAGDADNLQRFGTNIAPTAGTQVALRDHNFLAIPSYGSPTDVVLTAVGGIFSGGTVLIRVFYATLTVGHRGNPWLSATVTLSTLFGPSVSAANLIPADAWIIGVQALVTTQITGAAGFDVDDEQGATLWGQDIPAAEGTQTQIRDFRNVTWVHYPQASDVVLRAKGGDFITGAVQLTVYYANLTLPWATRTATLSGLSGASVAATDLLQPDEWVIGVTLENLTTVTGATGINVGDELQPQLWGANVPVVSGTLTNIAHFLVTTPTHYLSPTDVVVSPDGPNFTGGNVRLTLYISNPSLSIPVAPALTEALTLTEVATIQMSLDVSQTDAVVMSEVILPQISTNITLTDPITVGEFPALRFGIDITLTEAVTVAEVVTPLLPLLLISEAEALLTAEVPALVILAPEVALTLAVTGLEILTLSDQASSSLGIPTVVADAITTAEAVTLHLPIPASVSEAVSLTETLTVGLPLLGTVVDAIVVDELVTFGTFVVAISGEEAVDMVSVSDEEIAIELTLVRSLTEAITLTDSLTVGVALRPAVTDASTVAEVITSRVLLQPQSLEAITLAEVLTSFLSILRIAPVDAVTLTESIGVLVRSRGGVPGAMVQLDAALASFGQRAFILDNSVTLDASLALVTLESNIVSVLLEAESPVFTVILDP